MSDAYSESIFDDGRGRLTSRRQAQMLFLVVKGYAEVAMVHWYIREFHAFADVATRRCDIFHDWSGVTGFSSDTRRVFLKWGRERNAANRRICRGVHVLAQGPLVYLALEAAATFTRGYMKAYRSRQSFDLERDALLRRPSNEPVDHMSGTGGTGTR